MKEGSFGDIRRQFEDMEIHAINESGNDWPVYRTNALAYFRPKPKEGEVSFFNNFPDAEESIREDIIRRHERGERVLVFDICGIATQKMAFRHHTACLALKPPPKFDKNMPTRTIFEGDIFRKNSLNPLLNFSAEFGAPPAYIFFVPVGGLSAVPATNAMQGGLLLKQFRVLYDVLSPGGQMYLQVPPQLLLSWGHGGIINAEDVLRDVVQSTGRIEHRDPTAPLFRITKNNMEEERVAK